MKNLTAAASAFALAFILSTSIAHAQTFGGLGGLGGGGDYLMTLVQWFVAHFVQGLMSIAVVMIGGLLIMSRHSLGGIAVVVIGMLVISHYQEITGLFQGL